MLVSLIYFTGCWKMPTGIHNQKSSNWEEGKVCTGFGDWLSANMEFGRGSWALNNTYRMLPKTLTDASLIP